MSISNILLACFLALYGLLAITNIRFEYSPFILGALALATAISLFARK